MAQVWAILSGDSDASRVAAKAAGCTHAVINANWGNLQPGGAGSALNVTARDALVAAFDHAESIGLKPILSVNYHYAPGWVLSGLEPFKDQNGVEYLDTNVGLGKAVRNWFWTATGRTWLTDFTTKVATALGAGRVSRTDGNRLGAGWYGEVHYPQAYGATTDPAWQGFSASMQSGVDIAAGMDVCPLPGYVPYTGTDTQDCAWLNWYLNGIVKFDRWLVELYKSLGFTRNLYLMLPGYGVRSNQARTSNGYKLAAALGEDHTRAIAEFMHDPAVWPYSTWLNTVDGFAGGTADSDKAAWKSVYEKSRVRGKHHRLIGENTGNESNAGMNTIFADALGKATYAGALTPLPESAYYQGVLWLQYNTLVGGSQATMANFTQNIAAKGA